jgi:hypothetical protein
MHVPAVEAGQVTISTLHYVHFNLEEEFQC